MLSTSDNPYNPWTQYDKWLDWDTTHGYNTNSYVARLANTLDSMDEEATLEVYQAAVDAIMEQNLTGNYVIVPKPTDYVEADASQYD